MASLQACKSCVFANSLSRLPNSRLFHRACTVFQGTQVNAKTPNQGDDIVIPRRKVKDDFAVLRALGNTVERDPTAAPYVYHDDPHLLPRNLREKRNFKKVEEMGRKAAQYVIQRNPKLFLAYQHDEPKIEAFYPPVPSYTYNDPGEEAIMERVEANDVQESWQMYKATIEAGHKVSLETSNALLDLLCFHGTTQGVSFVKQIEESIAQAKTLQMALNEAKEQTPQDVEEDVTEEAAASETGDKTDDKKDGNKQQGRKRWQDVKVTWADGNEAEQLFEAMEEKNAHSYHAMIQGLVKHNAHSKAFAIYNEMQQRGFKGDLLSYNALILSVNFIRDESKERWQILQQLMKQMEHEGVRPDLYTFNALLGSLARNRDVGRMEAMYVLNEMKALGIEPSMGTYTYLRRIFTNSRNQVIEANILYDILDEVEGVEMTLRHPNDVYFFVEAMDVCLKVKDIELAYKLDAFLNTGNNIALLGNEGFQNMYYSRLFLLITQMENADAMLDYYKKIVPGAIIPNSDMYSSILQALETAEAYERIPAIWKDYNNYYHSNNDKVVDTLLSAMAMSPTSIDDTLKDEFCTIASDIMKKSRTQAEQQRRGGRQQPRRQSFEWSSRMLNNMITLYLKGNRLKSAWETLKYSMKVNQIPSSLVMEDFLAACISSADNELALGCIKVGVHFFMTGVPDMVERVKEEMLLTQDQRKHLDYILEGKK